MGCQLADSYNQSYHSLFICFFANEHTLLHYYRLIYVDVLI